MASVATQTVWLKRLGLAASVLLGVVLLVAAWAKILEPGPFIQQVRLEGLDFLLSAETVAVLAVALEAGLGFALLLGCRHLSVLVPSALLVAFFLFLTGRNYWLVEQGLRDPSSSCGCFGSLLERTAAEAFWQDFALLLPAICLAFVGRGPENQVFPRKRFALGLLAAVGVAAVVWTSPDVVYSGVAQRIASQNHDPAFRASSLYGLRADGAESPDSRVYQSEGAPELLADSPQLPWAVLIDPRSGKFSRVDRSHLREAEGDVLYLPEGAEFPEEGDFSLGPDGIEFTAAGRRWTISSR